VSQKHEVGGEAKRRWKSKTECSIWTLQPFLARAGTRLVLCCAPAVNHRRSSLSDADAGGRHSFFSCGDDPCPLLLPAQRPICQRPSDDALDRGSFASQLFLHGRNPVHFTQARPWLNLSIYGILGVRVPSVTHLRVRSDRMLTLWADLHHGHPLS
jgi:hypothetical protein